MAPREPTGGVTTPNTRSFFDERPLPPTPTSGTNVMAGAQSGSNNVQPLIQFEAEEEDQSASSGHYLQELQQNLQPYANSSTRHQEGKRRTEARGGSGEGSSTRIENSLRAMGTGPLVDASETAIGNTDGQGFSAMAGNFLTTSYISGRRGSRSFSEEEMVNMRLNDALSPADAALALRRHSSASSGRESIYSNFLEGSGYSGMGGSQLSDAPLLSRTTPSPVQQRPSVRTRPDPPRPEVVVPRWQPDVEVTFCPICRTQFSFFVRKHHCRKCGRVVCNSCSPHRITIPYPYIVQPPTGDPTTLIPARRPSIDPLRAGSSSVVASFGGGERVRLCNPCVPDPNVAPPQTSQRPENQRSNSQQSHHGRSVSSAAISYSQSGRGATASAESDTMRALRNYPRRPRESSIWGNANRATSTSNPPRGASYNERDERLLLPEGSESRSRSSTVGSARDTSNMGNNTSTSSGAGTQPPVRSGILQGNLNYSRPLPPAPRTERRRRIPEQDECWLCHKELPSRLLPNFEELRTQHTNACLEAAISRHAPGTPPPPATASNPPPAQASSSSSAAATTATASSSSQPPPPAAVANTPEARMLAREQAHAAIVLGANTAPPLAHRSGVFPYTATEKDCVDDAECTICLEEFEVGVEMGRLECFCRFHLRCIRDWFVNRPGQCPVHQHGSGD